MKEDRNNDNTERLRIIKRVAIEMEHNVAGSFCTIMGTKSSGLVFDYLDFEDFKDVKIIEKRELNKNQCYLVQKARAKYNGRLKRIATDTGISNLSSHVSRHSFAYYMLSTGASIEEISHALGHSSIEITQNYIKQFPSQFSDKAVEKFSSRFELT